MKKTICILLSCLFAMTAISALAGTQKGTPDGESTINYENFSIEFVKAEMTESTFFLALDAVFGDEESSRANEFFLFGLFPALAGAEMHVLKKDGTDLLDLNGALFDFWTETPQKRGDGKWIVPIQYSVRDVEIDEAAFVVGFSMVNGETHEVTELDMENTLTIRFK